MDRIYSLHEIKDILIDNNPFWHKEISIRGIFREGDDKYSFIEDIENAKNTIPIELEYHQIIGNAHDGDLVKVYGYLNYSYQDNFKSKDKQKEDINLYKGGIFYRFRPTSKIIIEQTSYSPSINNTTIIITKNEKKGCLALLLFFIIAIIVSACQSLEMIAQHSDDNLLDVFRKQASFSLNDPFPKRGYKLRGMRYHNIELHKFVDNDTLYYLKYNPKNEERNFYFSVIDKKTTDTLLVNILGKEQKISSLQKEQWLDHALVELGIENITSNNGLWTYFVPKYKMVKGNLPTDLVRTGYHREYETFNYQTAITHYYIQRHPDHKLSGFEVLGALYIVNMLSRSNGNNMRYNCRSCGLSFSNAADLRSHENAIHDY